MLYDIVIVGGGIISSYIQKRLEVSGLKILVIDHFATLNADSKSAENIYFNKIEGYANKDYGGLSEFWGGQIQDIDTENIINTLKRYNIKVTSEQVNTARSKVIALLGIEMNTDTNSKNHLFKRVLNTWMGQSRLVGRLSKEIIEKNKNFTLINGKVNSINTISNKGATEYGVKVGSENGEIEVQGKKIYFCGGVMGLADYLIKNSNNISSLNFCDHYSASLANISSKTVLGKAVNPFFKKRTLVTPRIYFPAGKFGNNVSIYAVLPFQEELGRMRMAKKQGLLYVLKEILTSKNFILLSIYILRIGIAFMFDKKVPMKKGRLNINTFIDTSILGDCTIKAATNTDDKQRDTISLTHNLHALETIKAYMIELISEKNIHNKKVLPAEYNYFECGYHAYGLTKEGSLASELFNVPGVTTLCSSELLDIGDRNPVFSTLVVAELVLNNNFYDQI